MVKIKSQVYAQTGDFFTPIAEVTNTLEKLEGSPILITKKSSITDDKTVVAGSPASYLDKTCEITAKVGDADQPFKVHKVLQMRLITIRHIFLRILFCLKRLKK